MKHLTWLFTSLSNSVHSMFVNWTHKYDTPTKSIPINGEATFVDLDESWEDTRTESKFCEILPFLSFVVITKVRTINTRCYRFYFETFFQEIKNNTSSVSVLKCPRGLSNGTCLHPELNASFYFGGEVLEDSDETLLVAYNKKEELSVSVLRIKEKPPARSYSCAHFFHNKGNIDFMVFGGLSSTKTGMNFFNDLWILNLITFCWTKYEPFGVLFLPSPFCSLLGKVPHVRAAHGSVIMKNKLYIFGGFCVTKFGHYRHFNDIWCFDFVSMEWMELIYAGIKPSGRYSPVITPVNEENFIISCGAEFTSTTSKQFFDAYLFSVNQMSISPKITHNCPVTLGQSLVLSSSIVYFSHVGIFCYDFKKKSFKAIANKLDIFKDQFDAYQFLFFSEKVYLWIDEKIIEIPFNYK